MKNAVALLIIFAVVGLAALILHKPDVSAEPATDLAPVGATLLDGLGDYSMPISGDNPAVQRWFDQGLMLTYGFNHEAAERSFLRAAQLDPDCAMCWWGAALVLGPNINAAMDPDNSAAARDRALRAQAAADGATEREQAYIRALATRYADDPAEDRTPLDRAFAEAMRELAESYPDDLDAVTLYAESLMTLQPWEYWDEQGRPLGHTETIVSLLESVMTRNPDHAGALHLYIHAVEASDDPERGVAAADRLRDLIPGSGHLVHMPAHIYARVGRWQDAVVANELAIKADDAYLAVCRPGPGVYPLGYVPHNHHFLWFAATMIGSSETALAAARSTAERTNDPELMRLPGLDPMQDFALTGLYANIRFGHWDAVVETPEPAADLPYMVAMWHYGQGMAAVRQDRPDDARRHYRHVEQATGNADIEALTKWDRYSMMHAVTIAERVLAAELALKDGDRDQGIAALHEAIPMEDAIPYDEPPGWHLPVRQILGGVLLDADRPADAEAVYREELRRNPENIWSLFGLEQALAAQDKDAEAQVVAQRYARAAAHADIELQRSYY